MTTLKSMTAYVFEQEQMIGPFGNYYEDYFNNTSNYAKFLSMPLELKIFLPCDSENNVLVEPENLTEENFEEVNPKIKEYYQAKSEVIFEGLEMRLGLKAISNNKGIIIMMHENGNYSLDGKQIKVIEDLVNYNLTLTQQGREKYKL